MRISSVPPPQHPTIQARPLWSSERVPSGRTAQRLCDLVAIATAAAFVLPVDELRVATRRTPYVAFARQSAMYLAHVSFGLRYGDVGAAFGRDRTTAARACRLVEDRRDDPAIDGLLASLECACGALRRRLVAPVQP